MLAAANISTSSKLQQISRIEWVQGHHVVFAVMFVLLRVMLTLLACSSDGVLTGDCTVNDLG